MTRKGSKRRKKGCLSTLYATRHRKRGGTRKSKKRRGIQGWIKVEHPLPEEQHLD